MKYLLIQDHDERRFSSRVNGAIAEGWQPQGGVSVAMAYDSKVDVIQLYFAQALVKSE